jgi:hypothetical protein
VITSTLNAKRGLGWVIAVVLAVIILFAGIWLGGHPSELPSALRGSFNVYARDDPETAPNEALAVAERTVAAEER